jgi:FRG domain-containing protein
MYKLGLTYGKRAFEHWHAAVEEKRRDERAELPEDLRKWRRTSSDAAKDTWEVSSYPELAECVSFLAVMNKRLVLLYRGQTQDWALLPAIFRPEWRPPDFGPADAVAISHHRRHYWEQLDALGSFVYEICRQKGLPRWRTLEHVREARWAVMQHYELWPTPLIDLTSSLRIAASFALRSSPSRGKVETGFLYVVGMPNLTGSVTHSLDDQLVLARLNAVCPPIAKRPHLQEGFLVGRFPFYDIDEVAEKHSNLNRRLIATFQLVDHGGPYGFWKQDFPRITDAALLPAPAVDELLADFRSRISYQARNGRMEWVSVAHERRAARTRSA